MAGGFLKQPAVLRMGGPGDMYVHVNKGSPWLCTLIAGQSYGRWPLKRTNFFDDIREQAASTSSAGTPMSAGVDKMQDLSGLEQPEAASAPRQRRGKGMQGSEEVTATVELPKPSAPPKCGE